MHFDYPYYAEPGDGCRDEIGLEAWTRGTGVKFVGTEAPNDAVVAGTPKFDGAYRCPQFASGADYISGTNASGIWNLSSSGAYEVECFVRPMAAMAGNILALMSAGSTVLTLGLDTSSRVVLACSAWGASATGTGSLALNTWSHVLLRVSNGTATVYVDGAQVLSASLTTGVALAVTEARLGGFVGQLDELLFKHAVNLSAPKAPTEPYQGILDIRTVGGYGNGAYGDEVISAANVQINTYAMVQSVISNQSFTVGARSAGIYGDFSVGDEVMIHVALKRGAVEADLGKYSVRRISAISGSVITLDKSMDLSVDGFELSSTLASNYYVQLVSIPNYQNLIVSAGATVVPLNWSTTYGGGIVALKCAQKLTLNGKIVTSDARGVEIRTDNLILSHNDIIDRFVLFSGQNIFVAAKNIECAENARIGNSAAGDNKGGNLGQGHMQGGYTSGTTGGSGYGGGGGGGFYESGTAGVVGYGGRGGRGGQGDTAGGKPGRNGPWPPGVPVVRSGANIIVIAEKAQIPQSVISSGGQGGGFSQHMGDGGGGTGLCYLAFEEAA